MALVARQGEGAQAARMAQPGGRLDLPLGAAAGLALARHDLERDVAAGLLVPGEPDGTRAAAAQRPQRPVATEHEAVLGEGDGLLHAPRPLRFGRKVLLSPGRLVHSATSRPGRHRVRQRKNRPRRSVTTSSSTSSTSRRRPRRPRRRAPPARAAGVSRAVRRPLQAARGPTAWASSSRGRSCSRSSSSSW